MLKYGLPLSIASILSAVLAQFYLTIMAIYVPNDALVGNYYVAQNFVVLITFFATPVTTMLFPAFSKLNPQTEGDLLRSAFQFSVKYASLIVVPVTVLVMVLAQPAIGTIFQDRYLEAPLFLALLSINYLYAAIGNLSLGNLLNGLGLTKFNMYLTLLTIAIGFPVGFLLISQFGIFGLIATTLTVGFPGFIIGLRYVKQHFGVAVNWPSSIKILFSSGIAGILTYTLISLLSLPDVVELALGVVAFVIFFVVAAVVSRTVTKADVKNVRDIVDSLGPLRRPLNLFVNLVEKLINAVQK
jgi:putative peptidoglycan lipid II flippase